MKHQHEYKETKMSMSVDLFIQSIPIYKLIIPKIDIQYLKYQYRFCF